MFSYTGPLSRIVNDKYGDMVYDTMYCTADEVGVNA